MDIWPIRKHRSTNPIDSLYLLAVDYSFDIVNFVILFSFVSFCAHFVDSVMHPWFSFGNFLCAFIYNSIVLYDGHSKSS